MLPLISNIIFQDGYNKYYQITFKVSNPQVKLVCIQEDSREKADKKRLPPRNRIRSDESTPGDHYDVDNVHPLSLLSTQDHLNVYGDTQSSRDDWIRRYINECEKNRAAFLIRPFENQTPNHISSEGTVQNSGNQENVNEIRARFEGDGMYFYRNIDKDDIKMRNTSNCNQFFMPIESESSSKDIPTDEIVSDEIVKSDNEIKSNSGLDVQRQYTIRIPDNCQTVGISLELADFTGEDKQIVRNSMRPTSQLEQRIFDSMEKSSNVLKACSQLKVTVHEGADFDEKDTFNRCRQAELQTFQEPHQLHSSENLITFKFSKDERQRSKSAQGYSLEKPSSLNFVTVNESRIAKKSRQTPTSSSDLQKGVSCHISQPTSTRISDAHYTFEIDFRSRLKELSKEVSKCLKTLNYKFCEESDKWKDIESNKEFNKVNEVKHPHDRHQKHTFTKDPSCAKHMYESREVRGICNAEDCEYEKSKKEKEKLLVNQFHKKELCDTKRKLSQAAGSKESDNDERMSSKLSDGDGLKEAATMLSQKLRNHIYSNGKRVSLRSSDAHKTERQNLTKSTEKKSITDRKKRHTRSPTYSSSNHNVGNNHSRPQSRIASSVNSYVIDNIMALNRLGFHSAFPRFPSSKASTRDASVQVNGYPEVGLIQKRPKPSAISRPELIPLKSLVKFEYSNFLIHFALPVMQANILRYKPWSSNLPRAELVSDEESSTSAEGKYLSSGRALVRLHNDVFQIDFELQDINFQHYVPKVSKGTYMNAEDWVYVRRRTSLGTGKMYLVKVPKSTYVYEDPMIRVRKENITKRQMKRPNEYCKEKENELLSGAERNSKPYCGSHPSSIVFVENEYVSASIYGEVGVIELLRNMKEDMKLMNSMPQGHNVLEDMKSRNSDIFKEAVGYYPRSVFNT